MPKVVELTIEIGVNKVSCPGVWLCPEGYVSLRVEALDSCYQTCLLPPVFPLMFKDVFYFRKRFTPSCAINNLICLLRDKTIYCELIQCANGGKHNVLAKYLGSLDDVLFPPDTCWSDGVDLLMRRCTDFPGILSPKIEISTKIRIDEVWQPAMPKDPSNLDNDIDQSNIETKTDRLRSKPTCHSVEYHRSRHASHFPATPTPPLSSKSCCGFSQNEDQFSDDGICVIPDHKFKRNNTKRPRHKKKKKARNSAAGKASWLPPMSFVPLNEQTDAWSRCANDSNNLTCSDDGYSRYQRESSRLNTDFVNKRMEFGRNSKPPISPKFNKRCHNEKRNSYFNSSMASPHDQSSCHNDVSHRIELRSQHIMDDGPRYSQAQRQKKPAACDCEICRRYHDLFHRNNARLESHCCQ